jgi:hypothetical protein
LKYTITMETSNRPDAPKQQNPFLEPLVKAERSVQNTLREKLSPSFRSFYEGVQENIEGAKAWVSELHIPKKIVGSTIELAMAVSMITTACTEAPGSKLYSPTEVLNQATTTEIAPTNVPTIEPSETTQDSTPTLSPQDKQIYAEMTESAPLTTPGAKDKAIKATSQAYDEEGWQELERQGFPEKAINSAVQIDVDLSDEYMSAHKDMIFKSYGACGNLMHIDGYWVVLSAGHVFKNDEDKRDINDLGTIILNRPDSLNNTSYAGFAYDEFGLATAYAQNIDFGVAVFPDDVADYKNQPMFDKDMVLNIDDLLFTENPPDGLYYGIGFPGLTDPDPTISFGARLAKSITFPNMVVLSNDLVAPGSSGGGEFTVINGKTYYVGATVGDYGLHPVFADSAVISSVGQLGKSAFDALIKSAIDNYNSKSQQ